MTKLHAILFLTGWMACPSSPSSDDSKGPGEIWFALSGEVPEIRIGLTEELLTGKPSTIQVEVTEISNPEKQDITVFMFLETENGLDSAPFGNFSFFPPDRPATFMVSMEKIWREKTANAGGADFRFLRLRMEPVRGVLERGVEVKGRVKWGEEQ
jgi:hypothetical protein